MPRTPTCSPIRRAIEWIRGLTPASVRAALAALASLALTALCGCRPASGSGVRAVLRRVASSVNELRSLGRSSRLTASGMAPGVAGFIA